MTDAATTPTSAGRRNERRREELLDAADELFRDRGVAATTVADITERAGVAKGTFYLYFESKDHVVAGLHERLCDGMSELVVTALAELGSDDYWAIGDELCATIIDYWIANRGTFLAIHEAGETAESTRLIAEYDERIIGMFEAAIRAGVEQGIVSVADPQLAAQWIFHGCRGTCMTALLAPGEIDRDRVVGSSQQFVRKVLRP